jgi:hypothetical protein
MMGRNVSTLAVSLVILAFSGSAASDIILNGTGFYLTTGDSYGLSQGYIIKLKSVSSEGSVWLELELNNKILKSEITNLKSNFTYNKTNRTIISLKVDNIYSGSRDVNLVSFYPVYQYIDPELPAPRIIKITPEKIPFMNNTSAPALKQTTSEQVIWVAVIILILILVYAIRKLW